MHATPVDTSHRFGLHPRPLGVPGRTPRPEPHRGQPGLRQCPSNAARRCRAPAPWPIPAPPSIDEQIALWVDANPPQLYRGGA